MTELPEYPVRIPKELYEATGESFFRKQSDDWRDVASIFESLTTQAKRVSEQDDRFLFSKRSLIHDRMTIIELTHELDSGQELSLAMYYQQEVNEAYFYITIFDEGLRIKTEWLPSGLMVAVQHCFERTLQFEPCLIGEDFVERLIAYIDHHKEVLEGKAKVYGAAVFEIDKNPFFSQSL